MNIRSHGFFIRDHTSRTTPAGVSSRGASLFREAEPKAAWMDNKSILKVGKKEQRERERETWAPKSAPLSSLSVFFAASAVC